MMVRMLTVALVAAALALACCPEETPVADETGEVVPPVEEAPEIKEVESPAAAPDFTVPLVSGGEVKLGDYQGKILVLDFWATWCVGCVEELPDYQALYEGWDSENVAYIGMSLDGDASTVAAFLEGRPEITLPMAIAPPEVVDAYIPRRTLPSSRVIDASGALRYEFTGPGAEKVGAAVEALLAEGGEG
jgi:thiol-disulfide isomerase/thioredoxin